MNLPQVRNAISTLSCPS